MFYDPYTTLARRTQDPYYTQPFQVRNPQHDHTPAYVSTSASSYWSDVGSPLQSNGLSTNAVKQGPCVTITFTSGQHYELIQIDPTSSSNVHAAATDLLAQVGLPPVRRHDLLFMVRSNQVARIRVDAVPGTRIHVLKQRRHASIALNDVELSSGTTTIEGFPARDDQFVLVIMRACGYFSCNARTQDQVNVTPAQNGWIYHQSSSTLSNLPGSRIIPNSPYVNVVW